MPAGEVIGAAIGIILLVLTAYALIGSVLTTSDVIIASQKDVALRAAEISNTRIEITDITLISTGAVNVSVKNTGGILLSGINQTNVIVSTNCAPSPIIYFNGTGIGHTWERLRVNASGDLPEFQHRGDLDPGETMRLGLMIDYCPSSPMTADITVVTENGITAGTEVTG